MFAPFKIFFYPIMVCFLVMACTIPSTSQTNVLEMLLFTASFFDDQHSKEKCRDQPASSLVLELLVLVLRQCTKTL